MKNRPSALLPGTFLGTILLLLVIGLFFVFEASAPDSYKNYGDSLTLFWQQSVGVVLGLLGFFIALMFPSKYWSKLAPVVYCVGIVLLVATLIPGLGREFNGAQRWLDLGFMVVQPVEIMKFCLVVFMASWMTKHKRIQAYLFSLGIPALLVMMQPDMGSTLVMGAIATLLYIAGGGSYKHLGLVFLGLVPIIVALVLIAPYRMQRITTFLNPGSDPQNAGYHVRQLTLALGRGGVFGQGIGNSSQKFSYVPEASTDSISAIIGEEVGFVGLLLVIGLYVLLLRTSLEMVKDLEPFQRLLAYGIIIWIAVQVLLNLAAASATAPLTGVPLPLISYGRTSLLLLLFALGVVFRLYLEHQKNAQR